MPGFFEMRHNCIYNVVHNCMIVVSNLFGFFDCQRRLLTQRPLLYCHHCSQDCPLIAMIGRSHYTPLPCHTAIVQDHSLLLQQTIQMYLPPAKIRKCLAPAKNCKKHQNLIQECPLVATINCPPLQTIAQNHSLFHQHMAPQHSYMGAGPLTIWNFFFFQK